MQRILSAALLTMSLLLGGLTMATGTESQVTITLDSQHAGTAIAQDFAGLSFEVSQLLPDQSGVHYFRPDNLPLINLFHTLDIKSLRIGGNTSDRDAGTLPADADLDSLFSFAKAARVKVIYCLQLHNGDPQADAATAKYIMDHYAAQMDCFSIGQEPSAYPVEKHDTRPNSERMGAEHEKYEYSTYHEEWKRFASTIMATVPEVNFCGPSVHNNGVWAEKFMTDFGKDYHVSLITEHLYAGGAGNKVPSPEIGRDRMLSDEFIAKNQKLYDGFVPMAISNGLPYRLEEVNNYFNGGATNVSNTFASALWGLDFMYWWAAHDAAGLNFHTGDKVAAGYTLQPSKYTAFFTTTNGFLVRPLGYALKAFDLGSHGKLVPLEISNSDQLNLRAYAVLGNDHDLYLTIINKEHGDKARDARVVFDYVKIARVQMMSLAMPKGDIAATSGESLGDGEIKSDGSWNGHWTTLPGSELGVFAVKVPAATAAVVKFESQ